MEQYLSFGKDAKTVDWQADPNKRLVKCMSQEQSISNEKSIYGGFMTSINEQIIDQFDRRDKKEIQSGRSSNVNMVKNNLIQ